MLRRNARAQEVQILGLAVVLAVGLVTAIALFASRLESAMVANANHFLAADRQIRSNAAIADSWQAQASEAGVRQAFTVEFASMVFKGDHAHLASVKAVSEHYPLLGELEVTDIPFGVTTPEVVTQGPPAGELWVEGRLFPLLNIKLGDWLEVGESELQVTRVLVKEPDRGQGFSSFGARVLMNLQDLPATGVIQDGSRASYRWLLAGDSDSIDQLIKQLNPALTVHQRVVTLAQAQGRVAENLARARSFLMLASVFGLLLAGIAVAIAAQRFCARHVDQVALLKSLGVVAGRIRALYFSQILWLCVIASAIGLFVGWALHWFIAQSLVQLLDVVLPAPGPGPFALGASAGLLCLGLFALPPLWPLPAVAPIKVLRRETPVATTPGKTQLLLGLGSFSLLLWLYTQNVMLTGIVVLAWVLVALLSIALCLLGLRWLHGYAARMGSHWRLAVASLRSRQAETLLQLVVFGSALMLLASLLTMRGSLLDEWRMQLPKDAPNHFVVNVAPHEVAGFEQLLINEGRQHRGLYPMVRGRITAINGEGVDTLRPDREEQEGPEALTRELNLSWSETLPEGNTLVSGEWWSATNNTDVAISVEQELAKNLGVALGDTVTFSIGGLELNAKVASLRSLRWDSFTPNFYVLFSPGALESFAPMYMTSFYAPDDGGRFVASIIKSHPTALVIEMDKIFDQIRQVVEQVSGAVELVFWIVLAASLLVLLAAVSASMEARTQELGLLRALGAGPGLLRWRLVIEFSALGGLAGLLAALGAEGFLFALQTLSFNMEPQFHPWLWIMTPVFGALVIGVLGMVRCQHLLRIEPAQVLRTV